MGSGGSPEAGLGASGSDESDQPGRVLRGDLPVAPQVADRGADRTAPDFLPAVFFEGREKVRLGQGAVGERVEDPVSVRLRRLRHRLKVRLVLGVVLVVVARVGVALLRGREDQRQRLARGCARAVQLPNLRVVPVVWREAADEEEPDHRRRARRGQVVAHALAVRLLGAAVDRRTPGLDTSRAAEDLRDGLKDFTGRHQAVADKRGHHLRRPPKQDDLAFFQHRAQRVAAAELVEVSGLRREDDADTDRAAGAPDFLDQPCCLGPERATFLEQSVRFVDDDVLEALGTTQPALTTQITRLERDLGQPLLERAERGRAMRPTPFGKRVVAAAREILAEEKTRQ
ncbi:LysR family transcriptional regulator [Streptomyces sp. NBC_01594]